MRVWEQSPGVLVTRGYTGAPSQLTVAMSVAICTTGNRNACSPGESGPKPRTMLVSAVRMTQRNMEELRCADSTQSCGMYWRRAEMWGWMAPPSRSISSESTFSTRIWGRSD